MSSSSRNNALQHYIKEVQLPISSDRLESYRPTGASTDLEMIVTYMWNGALSEALFPALQAVEVALRNSISAALAHRYGTDQWYDQPEILGQAQQQAVQRAKSDVFAAKGTVSPGRVVAELRFWFWISLLSQPYHHVLWAPQQFALIDIVFPGVSRSYRNRRRIHQRYNDIRGLRNRVFHYEPIWHRPRLLAEYREIIEAIGWISPTMRDTVALVDRFDDVYARGRQQIEVLLRRQLTT